ncbi:MAG: KGG domain-containing protein [bacterium]
MPGTVKGGVKAAETNKKRYGKSFYVRIGALGGKKSTGGGFAANPELAREAGRKGGLKSRKTKASQKQTA